MRRFFSFIPNFVKKHKIWSVIILIGLVILGLIFRPKSPQPIETVTIKPGNIVQVVSVSGTVDALTKADLTFVTGGQLVYLGAAKNDTVTAGQVIAQVDSRTIQKNLQTALLNYSEQRNTYDQTISNNHDISNPNDALSDSVKRILQNNQYDLQKAVASVELQDLVRQQSVLTTPISGVLTREDASTVGMVAGPTTVFEVIDPNTLVFSMDVDEADIGKVQPGQQVKVVLDAYPDQTFPLTVNSIDYISHATSNGGTAYAVKVKLPSTDLARFRIGMNGNGDITTAQKNHVLTVPLASLVDDNYVYVKTGKAFIKRKLVLGLQNDTDAEVLSGLRDGDQVVTQPSKLPQQKSSSTQTNQ